jgi:CDP-diacylglycerol--glycerol-3-phosphate 3-phosphatidyltransferase
LGKLLDPVADKVLTMTCLIMLVALGHADVWATIIIIAREFAIAGLRQVVAAEGVVMAAERGAKWKTAVIMVAIGFLLIHRPVWGLPVEAIGGVLLWIGAILSITSGLSYVRHYFQSAAKP